MTIVGAQSLCSPKQGALFAIFIRHLRTPLVLLGLLSLCSHQSVDQQEQCAKPSTQSLFRPPDPLSLLISIAPNACGPMPPWKFRASP